MKHLQKKITSGPPFLFAIRFACYILWLTMVVALQPVWAIEPDVLLFSDKIEERHAAYVALDQSIKEKLAAQSDAKQKERLLIEQQFLKRLQELPDIPKPIDTAAIFSELATKEALSWEEFDQYLKRYIEIRLEEKKNRLAQEESQRQLKILSNNLIALNKDDPAAVLLQLQYAYKIRKYGLQQKIGDQLQEALEGAKKQYPAVLKRTRIDRKKTVEEEKLLAEEKSKFQNSVDDEALSATGNSIRIQQQENVLQTYMGRELTDSEKKILRLEQAKLLELKVSRIHSMSQRYENNLAQLQQEQKVVWYQLLDNVKPNFLTLTERSNDILKQAIILKKDTAVSQNSLYALEKELALLKNTTDPIGPQTKKLLNGVNDDIRTIFSKMTLIDKKTDSLDDRGWLLGRAIDLKQTGIGAVVTKTREATSNVFEQVGIVLRYPIVSYNGVSVSLLVLLQVILIIIFGMFLNRVYGRTVLRMGEQHSWSEQTIHMLHVAGKYPLFIVLVMIVLSVLGVNTSSFAMIAGALSVGIGFGLKTIVNNLVSGIILLFDKSIRPGDFISLGGAFQDGGLRGNVVQMNIRASVLRTNDNINVIIPNAMLMESQVVNWTYGDEKVRFNLPFSTAYGTDADFVKKVVKEAMLATRMVLKRPEPLVQMTAHGDNAVTYNASVWVEGSNARRPGRTTDKILTNIYKALNENNLEIPFPQLDIHVRNGKGKTCEQE